MPSTSVVVRGTSVYLQVGRNWYFYDTDSSPLGRGAMGIVYIGRSVSNPGLRVAIKQVLPNFADILSIRKRALIEGGLQFGHPHLIRMVGCCEYDSVNHRGPIWIISHLVQGITLDRHVESLKRSKQPVRNIVETIYPVLDALDYLHGGGIVHLDIKPSNIMFENGHNIRLMDLGIASVGNAGTAQIAGLVGTPQYAAPEQFVKEGETEQPEINATTDIYQVGVTLYELLTSTNPYNAPTVHQAMELHRSLILPSNSSIPQPILEVLRKATSPQQNQRYQSASDMRQALVLALRKYESAPRIPLWGKILITLAVSIVILLLLYIVYVQA